MKIKHFLSISLVFFFVASGYSHETPQVRCHLESSETMVHKSVVTQIANLKQETPTASVLVVCNGPGVEFALNKNNYINKLGKLNLSDVQVLACEFTLSQRKVSKTQLSQFSGTVSHGIVEIVCRQSEKWSYIKAGF